jgi:hemoglobin
VGLQYPERGAVIACLYDRLGGAAALAAVVDDMVDRFASNPLLLERFYGRDLPQLKALGVNLLSARVGGPCGSDLSGMELTDASLRFSPKELHAALGDMAESLREQGVGSNEIHELVRLVSAAGLALPLRRTAADPIRSQERFKNTA